MTNNNISQIKSDRFRKITSGSASRFGAYIMGKRYVSGEYNLFEYGRILDTESIAAKAVARKIAVVFRNGWEIKSENKKNLTRIKERLKEVQFVTETSFSTLLDDIARSLTIYNNCYVLITRAYRSSTSKGRNGKPPIAGISVLPVETVDVLLDPDGNIIGYKQRVGSYKKEYSKDEVVHLFLDKRPGMILGTPPLEYVKDDIIALRKIEENVELLVDRSIFPLIHAKVGSDKNPAGILPDGTSEVDQLAWRLETIDRTGGLATNERVEIKAIGAESLALRVESYLNYFKSRVLMGLGVSAVDLGEGDSSGKANGQVLSLNIVDTAEQYQRVIEDFINKIFIDMMVDDGLIKSNYSYNDNDIVLFDFYPASQDKEVRTGSHYADLYGKGVVTLDEARGKIGIKELQKEKEKRLYHNMTNKSDVKTSKLAENIATPKNQHTKASKDFSIANEMISDTRKNYAAYIISKKIEKMNTGIPEDGVVSISRDVVDTLINNVTLSQENTIREKVTKYILE